MMLQVGQPRAFLQTTEDSAIDFIKCVITQFLRHFYISHAISAHEITIQALSLQSVKRGTALGYSHGEHKCNRTVGLGLVVA